jgi:hypothetical protein
MLPRKTCLNSAYGVLAVRISCRVIALFVYIKSLFINKRYSIYVCYTIITFGKSWNILPVDTESHVCIQSIW